MRSQKLDRAVDLRLRLHDLTLGVLSQGADRAMVLVRSHLNLVILLLHLPIG
jgi:hypothetical protein